MSPLPPTQIATADDTRLLGAYVDEHSQECFAELVRRHIDLVYATALRRVGGDQHLAADVVQAVFTDFARKSPSLRQRPVLTGWLYRSTRFAAAQAVRTERRRRTHEQEAHAMNELQAAGTIHWERIQPVIDDALEDLNDGEREAVLLRFFENRPFAEVGTKLAVSPDAARMRIDRALDKLRLSLARRGVASTAAALTAAFATQPGMAAPAGLSAKVVSGVFHAAGSSAGAQIGLGKITGLGKILAGCAVGLLGVGFVVYEATTSRPAAVIAIPVTKARLDQGPGLYRLSPPARPSPNSPADFSPARRAGAPDTRRAGSSDDFAIDRLDRLVGLTAEQRAAAQAVFAQEDAALRPFASIQERAEKGVEIRQSARAQIRGLLTPEQQKTYDAAPQRLGGGATQDPAGIASRVDRIVTLTETQTLEAAAIYQKQVDAMQALSAQDRTGPPAASIRQAAKVRLRALLTPAQQQRYDANPNGAEDLAARACVGELLRSSPAIAARVGTIARVTPAGGSTSVTMANEQLLAMKGRDFYQVQGGAGSETFTVVWEMPSPSAPIKITRIEGKSGDLIAP